MKTVSKETVSVENEIFNLRRGVRYPAQSRDGFCCKDINEQFILSLERNLYQAIMRSSTDMPTEVINGFKFKFNEIKQQELVITSEMITNFNSMVEMVMAIYYPKNEMEDKDGNPTVKQINLRRELAKKYLAQFDFDELDEIINKVNIDSNDDVLQNKVNQLNIEEKDLKEVEQ